MPIEVERHAVIFPASCRGSVPQDVGQGSPLKSEWNEPLRSAAAVSVSGPRLEPLPRCPTVDAWPTPWPRFASPLDSIWSPAGPSGVPDSQSFGQVATTYDPDGQGSPPFPA